MRAEYVGIRAGKVDENYLKSNDCRVCHTDHYASWARTYHSRMTQEARPETVQGDFEIHNTFEYLGVTARMEKGNGFFRMTFTYPNNQSQTIRVDRTVGSRRIEQYLTKQSGQYTRLPLAYDLINNRWMSLNGSFFYPDGENYFQHQSQWDGNCVFCHNVKAQPNHNFQTKQFNTEVTELGIACGACHGPAAHHGEQASSPLTRTLWRVFNSDDKLIVNPLKLTAERSMQVCGHCHGQRVPEPIDRIQELWGRGDPFDAGENLAQFYKPVERHTTIGNYSFANRFWLNGSPRLTAYEYQGVLRSKCFTKGDEKNRINCLTCHSMHEGDIRGQIKEENRGDKPCQQCHQQYEEKNALIAHTKHSFESTGSRCYNCHMPRVVYGVMSIHPTHDISVPDPGLTVTLSVPNACNLCHLEKSVNWAIGESKKLWATRFAASPVSSDPQFDLGEGPRMLFAGDALTRSLAAEAMSGGGPGKPDARWAAPYLVEALEDNYPIVRFFVANGIEYLRSTLVLKTKLEKPDYLARKEVRKGSLNDWRRALEAIQLPGQAQVVSLANLLRMNRKEVDIEVGE